jgi:hypothetical protein
MNLGNELNLGVINHSLCRELLNNSLSFRYKDLKSSTQQFLSSEKDSRNIPNLSFSDIQSNFTTNLYPSESIFGGANSSNLEYIDYKNSSLGQLSTESLPVLLNLNLVTSNFTPPITAHTLNSSALDYDRLYRGNNRETSDILSGKEEVSPEYMFQTY